MWYRSRQGGALFAEMGYNGRSRIKNEDSAMPGNPDGKPVKPKKTKQKPSK